jgi:flagellar assembly protein FliH
MERHLFDKAGRISAKDLEEVQVKRWLPPTIGKGGHLVYAEPREDAPRKTGPARPLGAQDEADLEALQAQATAEGLRLGRDQGFAEGKAEGFRVGQEEGIRQGLEQGRLEGLQKAQEEANEILGARLSEVNALLTSLTHALNEQDYQLETALMNLVQEVARAVIGRELEINSGHIMSVVRAALATLPPSRDNVRVIVNPRDLPALEKAAAMGGENWRAAASEDVQPGGCRIHSDQSVVDFTTDHRFRSMMEQLLSRQLSLPEDATDATAATAAEEPFEQAPEPVVKPFTESEA